MSEFYSKYDRFAGNPRVRRCGVVTTPYTEEQVKEVVKCSKDAIYFVSNYAKITTLNKGITNFIPYGYQKDIIKAIDNNRFLICKLPRQSGKTTALSIYFLWCVLFKPAYNVAILANKGDLAVKIMNKVRLAYELLPNWLQQGVSEWNKKTIVFENRSCIFASATSASAIRGESVNIVFLDEFAHVKPSIAELFFASVYPTISSSEKTKLVAVSTPNGYNHFYKTWQDAVDGKSDYVPIEVHWKDVPRYAADGTIMDPNKWAEKELENMSQAMFDQEYGCSFVGSAGTLINPMVLNELKFIDPIDGYMEVDVYENPKKAPENPLPSEAKIKDDQYVLTVDVARGIRGDSSAISIINISQLPYRQIGKYNSNTIDPMEFPSIIYALAKYYNNAHVLVEVNDVGNQIAYALHETYEYDNMFYTKIDPKKGGAHLVYGGMRVYFGLRMSGATKKQACSNLKSLIENKHLIVEDFDTISQLTQFVRKNSSYEAEKGTHDDLVDTLLLFAWLSEQELFKDMLDFGGASDELRKMKDEQIENEMLPIGMHTIGESDDQEIVDNEGNVWVNFSNEQSEYYIL